MLKLFVILGFAVTVASSDSCANEGKHIYRIGTSTCPCTAENEGLLRYKNKGIEYCNGKKYVSIGGNAAQIGTKDNPAMSCRQILKGNPDATSGLYYLKDGSVAKSAYCFMDSLCGEKGWTMILKADGHKKTFGYDSNAWSNQDVINVAGATGGLSEEETKLHTYHSFAFNRLCLGFKTGEVTKWQKIKYVADSLYSVIRNNKFQPTDIGRRAWKNVIPESSLQKYCNAEGFNVHLGESERHSRIRIGIIGNDYKGCSGSDSRLGIGGAGKVCGQDGSNTVGNTAKCNPDNGNKNIKSFAYIFAAMPHVEGVYGARDQPAASCQDIKLKRSDAASGMYYVKLPSKRIVYTYCEMSSICGSSGWSLIMKLDGKKTTFSYDSDYWKNKISYNGGVAIEGLNQIEMKSDLYHLLPFDNLCVGMKIETEVIKWVKIPKKASSLFSLIADGKYRATTLGRDTWKKLLSDSSLQKYCNKEGFNVYAKSARARIGIIGNEAQNCHSPDSRIAFGGQGSSCWRNDKNSVGNEAACWPDNGDKHIEAFGYILAQ